MDDKTIMHTILTNIKSSADLMLHGSIESSTPKVHNAFKTALNDVIDTQNCIYNEMSQKGWYQTQQVEQQKIDQAKQKYSAN
ncbi:MAG: spore coat protein [Eubacteriales bacterium]|jgi:spore coat protein CotF|nr:spore coat protein [Eubacteriales bacterium]